MWLTLYPQSIRGSAKDVRQPTPAMDRVIPVDIRTKDCRDTDIRIKDYRDTDILTKDYPVMDIPAIAHRVVGVAVRAMRCRFRRYARAHRSCCRPVSGLRACRRFPVIEIPPDPNLGIEQPIVLPPVPQGVALLISLPQAQPKADAPPNAKPAILVQSGQKPVLVYVSAGPQPK